MVELQKTLWANKLTEWHLISGTSLHKLYLIHKFSVKCLLSEPKLVLELGDHRKKKNTTMQKLQDQWPTIRQATEVSAFNMTKVNTGIKSPTLHINYFEKGKKKSVAEQPADSDYLHHQYERIIINL